MPPASVFDLPSALCDGPVRHLVLPFAACDTEAWWPTVQALPAQALPQLRALLQGMQPVAEVHGDARSLTPPHERLLAEALGWHGCADGLLPWAAEAARQAGHAGKGPWGWVTLCHWAMGREHATLSDPQALALDEAESRQLMAAMQPFFEEDGIRLHYLQPLRWLAEGEPLAQATASLDRVLGRNVDPWLPSARDARVLRRLQNEMQMLLYTHPVNEARQQQRQLTVNSLWFSGTGALPSAHGTAGPADLLLARSLAGAALADDWKAYAQAWQTIDGTLLKDLLLQQQAGQTVRLSLCGERGSLTLETAPGGLLARLKGLIGKPAWPGVLQGR